MAIKHDLIRNSGMERQYTTQGILSYAKYDRVCMVTGLVTSVPSMVQALAVDEVQTAIPVGTAHPDEALATARYYRAVPVNADDACEVVVTYMYEASGAAALTYTVEMDSGLQQVETDVEFNDKYDGYIPIKVTYWRNYRQGMIGPPALSEKYYGYGTINALRPIASITVTKAVSSAKAIAIENARDNYLGAVNNATFRGKGEGLWLCTGINTTYSPRTGEYVVRLKFDFNPVGWDGFARFQNAQYGSAANIFRDPTDGYTQSKSNGIKRCRAQPKANLNTLVGML